MKLNRRMRAVMRAANEGDVPAQLYIAASLATGDGVEKDEAAAVRFYTAAADQGSADAAYNLATMYERGEGVRLSRRKALSLYRKAEKWGSGDASVVLGHRAQASAAGKDAGPIAAIYHFAMAALNRDIRGLVLLAETLLEYPRIQKPELIDALLRASSHKGSRQAKKLLRSIVA